MNYPIYFVLCQNVVTDQASNNISALNILEELSLEGGPSPIPKEMVKDGVLMVPINMQAVSAWELSNPENELNFQLDIIDPNGRTVLKNKRILKIDATKLRQRINQHVNVFPLTNSGYYTFRHTIGRGSEKMMQETKIEIKHKLEFPK